MRPSRIFVRFVVLTPDPDSGHRQGLFIAMSNLNRRGALMAREQVVWNDLQAWFDLHLERPDRFARAGRAHAKKAALCWFKPDATEHIDGMRKIAVILEAHGHHVEMIRSDRPGYIVYEDEHQIAAEPFRDTLT